MKCKTLIMSIVDNFTNFNIITGKKNVSALMDEKIRRLLEINDHNLKYV